MKISNLPVWNDILSIPRESNFITIRDMKYKLTYYGELSHYSILSTTEIHLENVAVYDDDAEYLYELKEIYLPFNEHMTIEFPDNDKNKKGK